MKHCRFTHYPFLTIATDTRTTSLPLDAIGVHGFSTNVVDCFMMFVSWLQTILNKMPQIVTIITQTFFSIFCLVFVTEFPLGQVLFFPSRCGNLWGPLSISKFFAHSYDLYKRHQKKILLSSKLYILSLKC